MATISSCWFFKTSRLIFSNASRAPGSISMRSQKEDQVQMEGMTPLASKRWGAVAARGEACLLEPPVASEPLLNRLPEIQIGGGGNWGSYKQYIPPKEPYYAVLLIDDERHTEKLVECALPKAVPSVTDVVARRLFYLSRMEGLAVVTVTDKEEDAVMYAFHMYELGLRSGVTGKLDD